MSTKINRYPRYAWVLLGLAWIMMVSIMWGWQMLPALAYQLIPNLNLTQQQFTLIFTAPVLVEIFSSLPGGALGDRYGLRVVVAVDGAIAGVSGLFRAFMHDFTSQFILMLLYGIAWGMVVPNLPKLVGVWFPPKRTGLASGIYMAGMGAGGTLGLFTASYFPNFRVAFIAIGFLTLTVTVIWTVFARSCPAGVKIEHPDIISGVKVGLKNRNIWLLAAVQFLIHGAMISFQGNLPQALKNIHGMSPAVSSNVSAIMTLGFVTGNLFFPPLSDRVGLRKPFVLVAALVGTPLLYGSWLLAPGIGTWVLAYLGGTIVGAAPPILFAVPAELPEIGEAYVGGASGIIVSSMNAGGFLVSNLITSPIMASGTAAAYSTGFMVSIALLMGIVIPTLFLTETGRRKKTAIQPGKPELEKVSGGKTLH